MRKKITKINKIEDLEDDINENEKDEEKNNKINWTKESDKKLIDYYFSNINEDKSNKEEIINNLLNNELKEFNLDISSKDIKQRLHKLKVHKGQERSMHKFNKMYNIPDKNKSKHRKIYNKTHKKLVRINKNEDLLPNYIFQLSEKASNNEYKNNLYHCLDFIVEQLDSFQKKIDILGENDTDIICELIPTSTSDMNLLNDEDVKNILFSIGFYFNNDTEYITLEKDKIPDIELITQKIINFKNIIDENIEQDKSNEEERNIQKEQYVQMQKNKHNNSKKLRDYILTEEEAAKEREKELEKEMNMDLNNEDEFVIKSKKKKKKLVKKNKDLDLIKEEDEIDIEDKSKGNSGKKKDIIDDE